MHKSLGCFRSREQQCLPAENKTFSHLSVSVMSQCLMKAKITAFSGPIPVRPVHGGNHSF